MTERNKVLLSIVAALVVIRFLVVPASEIIQNQNEKIEALQLRFEKGATRLTSSALVDKQRADLHSKMEYLFAQYNEVEDPSLGRIVFQRNLENKAKELKVELDNIKWDNIKSSRIGSAEISLRFKSSFKSLIMFVNELNSFGFDVDLQVFTTQIRGQKLARKELGKAQGRLVLRVSYLVKE